MPDISAKHKESLSLSIHKYVFILCITALTLSFGVVNRFSSLTQQSIMAMNARQLL